MPPVAVPAYGTLLVAGFIVAIVLAVYRRNPTGLKRLEILELGYLSLIGGVIGARLLDVAINLDTVVSGIGATDSAAGMAHLLWKVAAFWKGGLAFYGGLAGGIAVIWVYGRYKKIPCLELFDFLTPPAAIGLAVTRLGCFLNGCCFGKQTRMPWAVQFPSHSHVAVQQWRVGLIDFGSRPLPVHPTQLYELVAALAIFALLWMRYPRRRFDGEIFFNFGLLYSAWRFISEFWRADSLMWSAPFSQWALNIHQLISIMLFLMFACLAAHAARRRVLPQGEVLKKGAVR
jgi:phosphatidylglycerol:prolipoprotein diacylglycerol transferase